MKSYMGYCDCCDSLVEEGEIHEETGQHIGCKRRGLVIGFAEPVVTLADGRESLRKIMGLYDKILQERGLPTVEHVLQVRAALDDFAN